MEFQLTETLLPPSCDGSNRTTIDLLGSVDGVDDGSDDVWVDLDGRVERDPAVVVGDLEVRAELEQRVDGVTVTKARRHVQRRLAVHVLTVDERPARAEKPHASSSDNLLSHYSFIRHGMSERRPHTA